MSFTVFKRSPELAFLAVCCIAGLVFFSVTSPNTMPPAGLIFGFAIILGTIYASLKVILRVTGLQPKLQAGQYTGLLFGGTVLPVLLLALQSLGQLTVRDVVALILLFAVGYFYMSRMTNKS